MTRGGHVGFVPSWADVKDKNGKVIGRRVLNTHLGSGVDKNFSTKLSMAEFRALLSLSAALPSIGCDAVLHWLKVVSAI